MPAPGVEDGDMDQINIKLADNKWRYHPTIHQAYHILCPMA